MLLLQKEAWMKTYEIRFPDAAEQEEAMKFEADDVCDALLVLQEKEPPRRAELWEDGRKLCQLARRRVDTGDIWVVGQEV